MSFLGVTRERTPHARLDDSRFTTFWDLDIGELMATMALGLLMPLFTFGVGLPPLLWILALISFPCWALFLFFVKRDGHNAAYWLGKMLPYWMRQREFTQENRSGRVTPAHDRLDDILTTGLNAVSFDWQRSSTGEPELHVYEEIGLPYRAWVISGGTPSPAHEITMPELKS